MTEESVWSYTGKAHQNLVLLLRNVSIVKYYIYRNLLQISQLVLSPIFS